MCILYLMDLKRNLSLLKYTSSPALFDRTIKRLFFSVGIGNNRCSVWVNVFEAIVLKLEVQHQLLKWRRRKWKSPVWNGHQTVRLSKWKERVTGRKKLITKEIKSEERCFLKTWGWREAHEKNKGSNNGNMWKGEKGGVQLLWWGRGQGCLFYWINRGWLWGRWSDSAAQQVQPSSTLQHPRLPGPPPACARRRSHLAPKWCHWQILLQLKNETDQAHHHTRKQLLFEECWGITINMSVQWGEEEEKPWCEADVQVIQTSWCW